MKTTVLRLSASAINSVRENSTVSDSDFCLLGGSCLVVRIGYGYGEYETRTFRSLDETHWKEVTDNCLDVWHSQQMSDWLSRIGRGQREGEEKLVGIALEDEKGNVLFRIGNPYA